MRQLATYLLVSTLAGHTADANSHQHVSLGRTQTVDSLMTKALSTCSAPAESVSLPEPALPSLAGRVEGSSEKTDTPSTNPSPELQERIAELITQLGAPKIATREAAQEELRRIGLPALDVVKGATRDADPEIAMRACVLAKWIGISSELSDSLKKAIPDATDRLFMGKGEWANVLMEAHDSHALTPSDVRYLLDPALAWVARVEKQQSRRYSLGRPWGRPPEDPKSGLPLQPLLGNWETGGGRTGSQACCMKKIRTFSALPRKLWGR